MGRRKVFVALALAGVLASACSSNPSTSSTSGQPITQRPSSPAKLTILSPKNGAVVHGTDVPVRVRLQGATIVPASTTHIVPTEGHLHVYIDDQIVAMNFGTTDVVHDVKPGIHALKVEFVASDHLPFDPPVISQTEFQVKA